jgi:hypothetical protein
MHPPQNIALYTQTSTKPTCNSHIQALSELSRNFGKVGTTNLTPTITQQRLREKQCCSSRNAPNCAHSPARCKNFRISFEENPPRLHMEFFGGLYMRSRLSPWVSLRAEVKTLKMRLFRCLKLVYSVLVFVLIAKN